MVSVEPLVPGRPLLPAVVGPWASYVIAREFGGLLEELAAGYEASPDTSVIGRQLRAAVGLVREAGRQQWEAHRARAASVDGSAELPSRAGAARSERGSSVAAGLTTGQVASRLRVTPRQVINLIEGGCLEATRCGRTWLIDPVSVEDLELRRSA
jgi:excisionase family DNA binding protein